MDKKALNRATDLLLIEGIYLSNSNIKLHPDFVPQFHSDTLVPQYRSGANGNFRQLEFSEEENQDNDNQSPKKMMRFEFEAGVRLINEAELKSTEKTVHLEITATFIAAYYLTGELDEEALEEFTQYNIGYHVWPYWREYVHSTCNRVGLPIIPVPLYKIPKKKSKEQD